MVEVKTRINSKRYLVEFDVNFVFEGEGECSEGLESFWRKLSCCVCGECVGPFPVADRESIKVYGLNYKNKAVPIDYLIEEEGTIEFIKDVVMLRRGGRTFLFKNVKRKLKAIFDEKARSRCYLCED